jgi:hypothetical protein
MLCPQQLTISILQEIQLVFGGTSTQVHGDSLQINKLAKGHAIRLMGTRHKGTIFFAGIWGVP